MARETHKASKLGLYDLAAQITENRGGELVLPAVDIDLDQGPLVIGSTEENRYSGFGYYIRGAGRPWLTKSGKAVGFGTMLRGGGLDLRGTRHVQVSGFAVADADVGVRMAASNLNSCLAGRAVLSDLSLHTQVGVKLEGLDERAHHWGDGQVDRVRIEGSTLHCGIGLWQNSRNTVDTILWDCQVSYREFGVQALEGSVMVDTVSFSTREGATCAIEGKEAFQVDVVRCHGEIDHGRLLDMPRGRDERTSTRIAVGEFAFGPECPEDVLRYGRRGELALSVCQWGRRRRRTAPFYADVPRAAVTNRTDLEVRTQ